MVVIKGHMFVVPNLIIFNLLHWIECFLNNPIWYCLLIERTWDPKLHATLASTALYIVYWSVKLSIPWSCLREMCLVWFVNFNNHLYNHDSISVIPISVIISYMLRKSYPSKNTIGKTSECYVLSVITCSTPFFVNCTFISVNFEKIKVITYESIHFEHVITLLEAHGCSFNLYWEGDRGT